MDSIQIVVACHKLVDIPQSSIYCPVEVGAVNRQNHIPGLERDDEGDNISDRNFTFCELSAQYWAWKHLKSDYIGSCHYRRFFYFGDREYPANDHEQIIEKDLNSAASLKYGLTNIDLIREKIQQFDLVCPKEWNVCKAPTPKGFMRTVKEHMIAYNIFRQSDVCLLLEIVKSKAPEYLKFVESYLNGTKYIGYNCFVMKRQLFNELCQFEFDVLREFDRKVEYRHRTQNQRRICGYMGEILFSAFVQKKKTEAKCRIMHCPMVFFEETNPPCDLNREVETTSNNIIWEQNGVSATVLSVCVRSFLEQNRQKERLNIILLLDGSAETKQLEYWIGNVPSNVRIRYFYLSNIDAHCVPGEKDVEVLQTIRDHLVRFLPCMITAVPSVLFLKGAVFARTDKFQESWKKQPLEEIPFLAMPNYKWFARCTDTSIELSDKIESDGGWFYSPAYSDSVVFLNLHYRGNNQNSNVGLYNADSITSNYDLWKELDCSLEYQWDIELVSSINDERQVVSCLPFELLGDYEKRRKKAALLLFQDCSPQYTPSVQEAYEFWTFSRHCNSYEEMLGEFTRSISTVCGHASLKHEIADRFFPHGSRRRRWVKGVLLFLKRYNTTVISSFCKNLL